MYCFAFIWFSDRLVCFSLTTYENIFALYLAIFENQSYSAVSVRTIFFRQTHFQIVSFIGLIGEPAISEGSVSKNLVSKSLNPCLRFCKGLFL